MQVTGSVTTHGGSWDGEQVLWKLSGVVVQVTGLVTTHGGSWMLTRSFGNARGRYAGNKAGYNTWRKLG